MCRYCELRFIGETEKDLIEDMTTWKISENVEVGVIIDCDTLRIKFSGISEETDEANIELPINYCPFCGRLLRENSEKEEPCDWCIPERADRLRVSEWKCDDMTVAFAIGKKDNLFRMIISLENILLGIPKAYCERPIVYCPMCGQMLI